MDLNLLYTLMDVYDSVPSDKFISNDDLKYYLQDDFIHKFKIYSSYVFDYTHLYNLKNLAYYLDELLDNIPDGTVIISPGDSPSKIIFYLKLMYMIDNNVYQYIDDDNNIVTKNITFINYPISEIQVPSISSHTKDIIDNYTQAIINYYHLTPDLEYVFLDYIVGGSTLRTISKSFSDVLGTDINFDFIDIGDTSDISTIKYFILNDYRCKMSLVPNDINSDRFEYYITQGLNQNVTLCNIIVLLLIMVRKNIIKFTRINDLYDITLINIDAVYDVKYYNIKTNSLNSYRGRISISNVGYFNVKFVHLHSLNEQILMSRVFSMEER